MRIGEITIPESEPSKEGMYLVRLKSGNGTFIARLRRVNQQLQMDSGPDHSPWPLDKVSCYGPLQFTELPDKLHTVYNIDPQWKPDGAPGRS